MLDNEGARWSAVCSFPERVLVCVAPSTIFERLLAEVGRFEAVARFLTGAAFGWSSVVVEDGFKIADAAVAEDGLEIEEAVAAEDGLEIADGVLAAIDEDSSTRWPLLFAAGCVRVLVGGNIRLATRLFTGLCVGVKGPSSATGARVAFLTGDPGGALSPLARAGDARGART